MQNYKKEAEIMAVEITKIINRLVKALEKIGLTADQIKEVIKQITEQ
ncbi:MAG: hypothetical protein J1E81_06285 [Eubacterium sp.]|nr:hypothetical protein [Eubacterium sp.]